MIFNEIYGAYYKAMAAILTIAAERPVSDKDLRSIASEHAFSESFITIEKALTEEKWQLIKKDGTTPIHAAPEFPLTELQKRWLKAIIADQRMKLFDIDADSLGLEDVTPLFCPEDICVFDKYKDGDPYDDPAYIDNFKKILKGIKQKKVLKIDAENRMGNKIRYKVIPYTIEYSEKDDKFRLLARDSRYHRILNIARIKSCEVCEGERDFVEWKSSLPPKEKSSITAEIYDERNALERAMLHFAHFEKEAENLGDGKYRMTLKYDKEDEKELIIRVLSFGPFMKVVEPAAFVQLVKERLKQQKEHTI